MISGKIPHVSSGTLQNSFDRRTLVIAGLQAGVGVLLAALAGAWVAPALA